MSVALVLCPRSMTAPLGGPAGLLGDRMHQLPALRHVAERAAQTLVWPDDPVTRAACSALPVELLTEERPEAVVERARAAGARTVYGLYADPANAPYAGSEAAEHVRRAHALAVRLESAGADLRLPAGMDPRGRVPLWKRLYQLVDPEAAARFAWPAPPFLAPDDDARAWAAAHLARTAAGEVALVLSPFSGGEKAALAPAWWAAFAARYDRGPILVPVHGADEAARARALFAGLSRLSVVEATVLQVAALAAAPRTRVFGIDGGRMCALAAASPRPVLAAFGSAWPASAWSLPTMDVIEPEVGRGLTPAEALLLVP